MDHLDEPNSDELSSQEHATRKAAARLLVEQLHVSSDDTVAAYAQLQAKLRDAAEHLLLLPDRKRVTHSRSAKSSYLPRWVWPISAGLVLGTLAIVVGWHTTHLHPRTQLTPVSVYTTGKGQRANVVLPDGDTVVLNVASRLEVPANYLAGNHTVTLSGEAIYHVAHHAGAPFTVVAGGITTRVLGTTFLIRRYPTDSLTTVAVSDGKVAVRSVVLSARQQVTMPDAGVAQVQPADLGAFSFASGVLTLNGVPMTQAIAELNRWYDADIRLGDSAVEHHVLDATFASGSLSDLSEVLKIILNVRVVRNGRVLTLYTK